MPPSASRNPTPTIFQPLIPSLQVGAASGIGGFLLGGGVGILRSAHPGLAAAFTGTQFFVLGSSFLYSREVLLGVAFPERNRRTELLSSTVAGAISGAIAGAFYGKTNSVGGAVVIGTVGHLGQRYVHAAAKSNATGKDRRPLMDRLASSKWIPFKSLSNSEYEDMLNEKLLKVEAEISMIDEKIAGLRASEAVDANPSTTPE